MTDTNTLKRIVEAAGVTKEQVDLVGKILATETDERVVEVRLGYGRQNLIPSISSEVAVREQFRNWGRVYEFLEQYGLPKPTNQRVKSSGIAVGSQGKAYNIQYVGTTAGIFSSEKKAWEVSMTIYKPNRNQLSQIKAKQS